MSPANPHRILPRSKKHRPIKPQMYRHVEPRVEYPMHQRMAPPDFWNALGVEPRSPARFRELNQETVSQITKIFPGVQIEIGCRQGVYVLILIRPKMEKTPLSKKLLNFLNLPH